MRLEESFLTLRVRPNDLDSLGHVNNATALEYLEAGRWAWMEQHALRRGGNVIAVTMRIEIDYRREIAPQEVVVRTVLQEPTAEELEDGDAVHYRARFHQQILVDSGRQVAVDAQVQAAFVSAADRSLCSVQDFLATARKPAS
ncbi:acyl-CoA thioesterase [Hyalangium versicolor]|uniref:acyl-CoA thioesterase n=1 Tax=Hyalangium versicolor TaxID=2861190 RepID=UPI001CCE203F|nr:acyl-CoA thioesterase [Hyalangium versicolor]